MIITAAAAAAAAVGHPHHPPTHPHTHTHTHFWTAALFIALFHVYDLPSVPLLVVRVRLRARVCILAWEFMMTISERTTYLLAYYIAIHDQSLLAYYIAIHDQSL